MNIFSSSFRWRFFNSSLRVKITMIFIIPVIITMVLLSFFHIADERADLELMAEENAAQLADMMLASLNHALMMNDREMIHTLLRDITSSSLIENAQIVAVNLKVYDSADPSEIGKKVELQQSGCMECHQFAEGERPRSMRLDGGDLLRVAVVMENRSECRACHSAAPDHLGVLLVDASLEDTERILREHTISSVAISLISVLVVMGLSYVMVQWLVVRRVEVIRSALLKLGGQDFSARVSYRWKTQDELTELGDQFNRIAADLESLQIQKQEKDRVRILSIIEERQRIGRELHDGVAQFLAYLTAKVGAIRVELQNHKIESADKNLQQIERSVQEQSIEVRSSILGLKMAGDVDKGLVYNVREFVTRTNRFDDLQIGLEFVGDVSNVKLDSGKELQLIRILQESISNIRKHAGASEAFVRMEVESGLFRMTIADNGVGFDLLQIGMERVGHFGLQIIFERANEICAHIEVKTAPHEGTKVIVTVNVSEN